VENTILGVDVICDLLWQKEVKVAYREREKNGNNFKKEFFFGDCKDSLELVHMLEAPTWSCIVE
jgi:hypothetical protein